MTMTTTHVGGLIIIIIIIVSFFFCLRLLGSSIDQVFARWLFDLESEKRGKGV